MKKTSDEKKNYGEKQLWKAGSVADLDQQID